MIRRPHADIALRGGPYDGQVRRFPLGEDGGLQREINLGPGDGSCDGRYVMESEATPEGPATFRWVPAGPPQVFDPAALRFILDGRPRGIKAALAAHVGISRMTLDLWLRGRGQPNGDQERKIAAFLGVEQGELLKDQG